ncbi:MAG: PKD domain-containing protein [Fimbriimonadaceae bacterium]|nr:PKD domain-containing protein [Chitinophagales bacterium]
MKKLKLLLIIFLFSTAPAFASHIIGGELITECLGDSTYKITLILYRDCTSLTGFDASACIGVFDEDGDLVTTFNLNDADIDEDIEIISPDPCLDIPPDICVSVAVYTGEYTLESTTEAYDFVYQRCCRNAGIVNIETPDDVGASYWAHVPPVAETDCDNSPYFTNYPPLAICVGSPIYFDHSATDPDGDSLVYKFITPYIGGDALFAVIPCPPTSPEDLEYVDWESGYDDTYFFDATPLLAIDPVTGLLTGTPTEEGRYVVGIAVDEYRDGVLLSTHFRDFQFNVQICEPSVTSDIDVDAGFVEIGVDTFLSCTDLSVAFDNLSDGAITYFWDFGVGGISSDTSILFEPTYTYPDTGIYYVMLVANPGTECGDTAFITVNLYYTLTADFDFVAFCTGEPVEFNDESISTYAGTIDTWNWDFGDGLTSEEENPDHSYAVGGTYDVVLTIETDKGCVDDITITVDLLSGPDANFTVDDVCLNEEAQFNNLTTFPADVSINNYVWYFDDGNISSEEDPDHQYDSPGEYEITLIAFSTNGCSDTITQQLSIGELPFANAGVDDTILYLEEYILNGSGNGTFFWTVPLDYLVTGSNVFSADPIIRPKQTYSYVLEVTSPDGCIGYDTVTIYIEDITIVDVPNAFSPNGDGVNDEISVLDHSVEQLLEFSIYNRWGQQVFTTNDLETGWDGKVNGEDAEIGTYAYLVRAHDLNGTPVIKKGNITLVR